MANPTQRARQFELALVGGPTNLALDVPAEEAPGADEVDAAALSVAVEDEDLGGIDEEPREPHRSFYHPYG